MLDEFYVFLPSNIRSDIFPENKTSKYSTALPNNLELGEGDIWEVCLAEITYPHTWFNITLDDFVEVYKHSTALVNVEEAIHGAPKTRVKLKSGYYNSNELIATLNEILVEHEVNGEFHFKSENNTVSLRLGTLQHIKLSKNLAAILGFIENRNFHGSFDRSFNVSPDEDGGMIHTPLERNTYHHSNKGLDINNITHNIFVYTNIINYSLVGNVYAPILRTVPTYSANRGSYVTKEFIHKYYHRLSSNYIKQITIDLRDDQGENIKFHSGKVSVILHFRRKLQH
jgi:hypothetical protein